MNQYTREDIIRLVEEEDVGFIRLQFTEIFGTFKNIAITPAQLEKALDNQCMFDGSAIAIPRIVRIREQCSPDILFSLLMYCKIADSSDTEPQ